MFRMMSPKKSVGSVGNEVRPAVIDTNWPPKCDHALVLDLDLRDDVSAGQHERAMRTALGLVATLELAVLDREGEGVLVAAALEVDGHRDLIGLHLALEFDRGVDAAPPRQVVGGAGHGQLALDLAIRDLDEVDAEFARRGGSVRVPDTLPDPRRRPGCRLLSEAERCQQHAEAEESDRFESTHERSSLEVPS